MIFSNQERDRRWECTRTFLADHGLDAVLARGTPAADGQGHYRWLSLYAPLSADGAVLIGTDDEVLLTNDGPQAMYASRLSWFSEPVLAPGIVGGLIEWLGKRGVRRLGVADLDRLPYGWVQAIHADLPGVTLVDVGEQMLRLRTAKSAEELDLIERSANLADQVWNSVHEVVRPGRTEQAVLADVERELRAQGCDANFNLIMHLQRGFDEFDRQPSDRPIARGDSFLLEVSPRFAGYYTQLTNVVSVGTPRDDLAAAFEAANAARAFACGLIRPGAQAQQVGSAVTAFLEERGYSAGPTYGHMVGLEIEEPRLGPVPYEYVEDSVFVFHPVVSNDHYPVVLRGDTYRLAKDGPVRLNTLSETLTVI